MTVKEQCSGSYVTQAPVQQSALKARVESLDGMQRTKVPPGACRVLQDSTAAASPRLEYALSTPLLVYSRYATKTTAWHPAQAPSLGNL